MRIPSVYEKPKVTVYQYDDSGKPDENKNEAIKLGREFAEFLWNNVPSCFYESMQERLKELNEKD